MPSPLDTSVKFLASWMPGAPQFGASNIGNMITALDIMVNGMDSRACTISVTSGLATMTFSGGAHAAVQHAVILVAGTGNTDLNGEQKVLTADSTTITFPTNAVNGSYSGTFSLAPMGWEKPFSGTNKGAYRSLDVTTERIYLRVEHMVNTVADVRAYRTMSGIDTGTDPFPDFTTRPTFRWSLRQNTLVGNAPYLIITDGKRLFFFIEHYFHTTNNYVGGSCHFFGPMISRPEIIDPNNTVITGTGATTPTQNQGISHVGMTDNYVYVSKEYTGLGTHKVLTCALSATGAVAWSTGQVSTWGATYPDPVTGALISSSIFTVGAGASPSAGGVRGKIPGYQIPAQVMSGIFATGDVVEIEGKKYFAIRISNGVNVIPANCFCAFIDVEGPWV